MPSGRKQKLYCYVDETGQDTASDVFIVVAVLSDQEQEELREALIAIEQHAGVGRSKWHDAKAARRLRYIELALERKLGQEEVFFGSYPKPLPYFVTNDRGTRARHQNESGAVLHRAGICGWD